MEKIKIKNQLINLVPMGISEQDKKRTFIIETSMSSSEIELLFSDVGRIEYLSEGDEVLAVYLDGVSLKRISKDYDNNTYTIEISTDATAKKINDLQVYTDNAICELTMLVFMGGMI